MIVEYWYDLYLAQHKGAITEKAHCAGNLLVYDFYTPPVPIE